MEVEVNKLQVPTKGKEEEDEKKGAMTEEGRQSRSFCKGR